MVIDHNISIAQEPEIMNNIGCLYFQIDQKGLAQVSLPTGVTDATVVTPLPSRITIAFPYLRYRSVMFCMITTLGYALSIMHVSLQVMHTVTLVVCA